MERLKGKVAIVTGAASGIGLACAARFAEEGAAVVGVDASQAPTAWEGVEKRAGSAPYHVVDVRDGAAQQGVAEATVAEYGRIDVLVTAAGVPGGGPVHLISEEDWDRTQDINLKGTFLSVKSVLPSMLEQRSGSIITIASVEGLEGAEGGSAYNASKGGVILLTKNLCLDYGRRGIRANAICPGFIETPMFEAVTGAEGFEVYRDRIRDQHKLGRFGKPEEIAGAAFFLASDDSSFVSGQALAVDGGFTAGHRFGYTALMGLD
jgi:NAD(P)-dependent dehydrogenase (short-subunit alcohol dehydrogenase family)